MAAPNVQPGSIATEMNPLEGEFADMLKKFLAVPGYGTFPNGVDRVLELVGATALLDSLQCAALAVLSA
jgi:hypothetical protein